MSDQPEREELVWEEDYSVNVKEIDEQHKHLFVIINQLVDVINDVPREGTILPIVNEIIAYKAAHFGTEDKYFHQFNFEGTLEHEKVHQGFGQKIKELQAANEGDVIALAFDLVDFLEDWLIGHLMNMDKKYIKCFNEHGLY
jgi:hemerythrin-like metal-binding protein